MKTQDLEKLLEGLDEEARKPVIDKIMELHGKDIEGFKSKLDNVDVSAKEIQTQLENANKTIEEMKKLNPEDLQKKADDWKAKAEQFQQEAEQARKDAESKVEGIQFGIDFDNELKETWKIKPEELKAVKANLNMDTIKRGDETIKFLTLSEQMKPLLESHPHYANSDNPEPKIISKTNGKPSGRYDAPTLEARKAMGLPID